MKLEFSKFVLGFSILTAVFTLNSCCKKKCNICKDQDIKYDTVFLGKPDKCDLIILKKKKEDKSGSLWPSIPGRILSADPIDPALAIQYIKNYNEINNPNLTKTTFIDFDITNLITYLANTMTTEAGSRCTELRIYMATNNNGNNNVILVGKNGNGDYYDNASFKPLDYGGLCPPPDKSCITAKQAQLLLAAIRDSHQNPPPIGSGRTVIVDP